MSVGVLGRRFRGVVLTSDFGPLGTLIPNDGTKVILDGNAYSNVIVDSDGFAGQGVVAPVSGEDPWSAGNYVGDGRLVVPPDLAGVYLIAAEIQAVDGLTLPAQQWASCELQVDGYAVSFHDASIPLAADAGSYSPGAWPSRALTIPLRAGAGLRLAARAQAGAPNTAVTVIRVVGLRWSVEYAGAA